MAAVFVFSELVHPFLFLDASAGPGKEVLLLAFLPRMLTSLVCALYLCAAWVVSAIVLYHAA
jgi:hypothetical protein